MALTSTVVFEVRKNGSDTNGGGFDSAAAGTDFSLQDAAQVVIDNSAITCTTPGANSNTLTFTAGYTATAADVGNLVSITAGTNINTGLYLITGQGGTTWTLTGAQNLTTAGGGGSAITGNMGGAFASLGKCGQFAVTGNSVWLKYNASAFNMSSASYNVAGGGLNTWNTCAVRGYDQVRGDHTGNRPTIQCTTNNIVPMIKTGNNVFFLDNLILNMASQTGCEGLLLNTVGGQVSNVKVMNFDTQYGIRAFIGNNLLACEATGCSVTAFDLQGGNAFGCESYSNTNVGFSLSGGAAFHCASYNNSGASHNGFIGKAGGNGLWAYGCIAYGNGGDGFAAQNTSQSLCVNCISLNHLGAGLNGFKDIVTYNCAAFNNTTNFNVNCTQTGTLTLTADPFNNAAGGDFSLNNNSGAGLVLQAAGIPAAFPRGLMTGFPDVGAVQHKIPNRGLLRLYSLQKH